MNLENYGVIGFFGSRGKGKTATGVRVAKWHHLNGRKIFANISLKFGEKIKTKDLMNVEKFAKGVILIDEPQRFFDSRSWKNEGNLDFGNFLNLLRKFEINLLLCSQYLNLIDKRIRQQIDLVCYPEIKNGLCVVKCFDVDKIENDSGGFKFKFWFRANEVFEDYNTREVPE